MTLSGHSHFAEISMQIPSNNELRSICQSISAEGLSLDQWAEIESDDMFQSASFCGGFDADEQAFLFSWYASDTDEFWFQLSIEEVVEIANGGSPEIFGRPSEA
jgi:hypothetical protein